LIPEIRYRDFQREVFREKFSERSFQREVFREKFSEGRDPKMNRILSKQWARQTLEGQPPARKGGTMAYDASHQVTLLFGGGGLNDTWFWDGSSWSEQHPVVSPPARTSACMAYDSLQQNILLFGGVSTSGLPLNDTWTWDGQTWMQHRPIVSPEARCGAVMAYATVQQTMLLFGGEILEGRTGRLLNDTWTWDGAQWSQQSGMVAPAERLGASLAYDEARQEMLLFGGTAASTVYADTWTWSSQGWQERFPLNSPTARSWSSMVYDASGQQIVLIGGSALASTPLSNGLNDTWQWDGSNWSLLSNTSAPTGGYHSAAYDSSQQMLVLYASTSSKPDLGDKQSRVSNANLVPNSIALGETWLWRSH
jgi:Kelch motif